MGLFSFLSKNKQETTAEDSGYYSRTEDDALASRARSKRASSAGEPASKRGKEGKPAPADPVLPEKKRARRRLVGAIALALAVAVGLPMVLDSEPKPLASDIAIQIPSEDKAPPLPVPAAAASLPERETLDKREEIIEPPKAVAPAPIAEVKVPTKPEPKEAHKVPKAEPKPEPKPVEPRVVAAKPAPKVEDKPVPALAKPAATGDDASRAIAILEDKPATSSGQKFVVQVAALASQEKVNELQGQLKEAGIKSFTHKVQTQSGERIRIQVGPFSKEEAEKMRGKLAKLGLGGIVVPT